MSVGNFVDNDSFDNTNQNYFQVTDEFNKEKNLIDTANRYPLTCIIIFFIFLS